MRVTITYRDHYFKFMINSYSNNNKQIIIILLYKVFNKYFNSIYSDSNG